MRENKTGGKRRSTECGNGENCKKVDRFARERNDMERRKGRGGRDRVQGCKTLFSHSNLYWHQKGSSLRNTSAL